MIPHQITRQHILQALARIDAEGVPEAHQSTKFDLLHDGRRYPPKYAVSLAHVFVNGEEWSHELFSGGEETNSFLAAREFTVVEKQTDVLPLTLYQDYTREDVQRIFEPEARFSRGAGTWGIFGIMPIPRRDGDFVFFVTFGQQQGEHTFDEGITEDGVLSWQSQPKQKLDTPQVRRFIGHDELRNSIYLFLRTREGAKYTYLGRLMYKSHDTEREQPVYFQWQIIEGSPPTEVCRRTGLILQPHTGEPIAPATPVEKGSLQETPPPVVRQRQGTRTATFRARKVADYSLRDANNRSLGLAGETLVLRHEKESLAAAGRQDLAGRVRHTSVLEGDGAGFDIQSFEPDGRLRYIEVKTTRGVAETPFYMTSNEVEFSRLHGENYVIYRVYEYDKTADAGKFYVLSGNVADTLDLTPTQYRASYVGS